MNNIEQENNLDETNVVETILKMSVVATLSSLGVVLSVFVVLIPNVEFISFTIFLISVLFGFNYGFASMLAISLIYELIVTPIYGSSGMLIFFKLLCYFLLVVIASLGRKTLLRLSWWELGVFGSFFALLYDLITTIGGQWIMLQANLTLAYLISIFIFGIPFTISHVVGNFLTFSSLSLVLNWIKTAFKYRGVKLFSVPLLNFDYKGGKAYKEV
ncbi:MAG: hypothetical protein ACTSQE_09775 [Candidatus Heimdallarchaeaceae archaeon]